MSGLRERSVRVNGESCRVLEKGSGVPFGFLAGLGGLPGWSPFLDRLAEHRRVIVPSVPGFPGACGHDQLDSLIDWVAATLDLLEASELVGCDLMGASVGGTLLAETAAVNPGLARRLVLAAPFGLYDAEVPGKDPWAVPPMTQDHLACSPERLAERFAPAGAQDPIELQVLQTRAQEAAARLLWPTTDTGLERRLHRIRVPVLLLWGEHDALVPVSYAKRFSARLGGDPTLRVVPGAGHLVELDDPEACADAVLDFCVGR